MQNNPDQPESAEREDPNIEEQLAYINETIREIENEDCSDSDHEEKPPTPNAQVFQETEGEESETEVERRECDSCKIIPDEIINMNCVHNICVDCTLSVRGERAGVTFS